MIPTYPLGGKRALLDNGVWFQSLQRDNVDLVTDPIAEITADRDRHQGRRPRATST